MTTFYKRGRNEITVDKNSYEDPHEATLCSRDSSSHKRQVTFNTRYYSAWVLVCHFVSMSDLFRLGRCCKDLYDVFKDPNSWIETTVDITELLLLNPWPWKSLVQQVTTRIPGCISLILGYSMGMKEDVVKPHAMDAYLDAYSTAWTNLSRPRNMIKSLTVNTLLLSGSIWLDLPLSFPHLTYLNCTVNPTTLMSLSIVLPNLKFLTALHVACFDQHRLIKSSLFTSLSFCPSVQELHLTNYHLSVLEFKQCRPLLISKLSLSGYNLNLTQPILSCLCLVCPKVKHLEFDQIDKEHEKWYEVWNSDISLQSKYQVQTWISNLETLSIENFYRSTSQPLDWIPPCTTFNHLTKLKFHMEFIPSSIINWDSLSIHLKEMKCLHTLEITIIKLCQCPPRSFFQNLLLLPSLTNLKLRTSGSYETLVDCLSKLVFKVTHLELNVDYPIESMLMMAPLLLTFLRSFPELKTLNLETPNSVRDEVSIYELDQLDEVVHLLKPMSDLTLITLNLNLSNMESIELEYARNSGENNLFHLVENKEYKIYSRNDKEDENDNKDGEDDIKDGI